MGNPLLVGIEVGGTKLQLGLGRGDGRLIALERRDVVPADGAEGIRAQIRAALPALTAQSDGEVAALGIGFGGPVDAIRGRVIVSNQIDGWADFALADWVREALEIPRVALQNDADTAALGEARFGAGVGVSPVLYVTIGSGIGGGLVVDGSIYRGAGLGAVEIGHLVVEDSPAPTTLEAIASGWSIGRTATERFGREITAKAVGMAAEQGNRIALDVLASATVAMGRALAHAVTLLAPRRVILGGGVSLLGEALWFAPIRREVERRVFPPFRGTYEIVPAERGEAVVVHGALALAADAIGPRP